MKKPSSRVKRRVETRTTRLDRRKDDEDVADHISRGVRAGFVRHVANDTQSKKR